MARLHFLSAGFCDCRLPRCSAEFLPGMGVMLSEESPDGGVLAAASWDLARERGALKVEKEGDVERSEGVGRKGGRKTITVLEVRSLQ